MELSPADVYLLRKMDNIKESELRGIAERLSPDDYLDLVEKIASTAVRQALASGQYGLVHPAVLEQVEFLAWATDEEHPRVMLNVTRPVCVVELPEITQQALSSMFKQMWEKLFFLDVEPS